MKSLRSLALTALLLCISVGACVGLAGCDSFERNAFKTLSSSKAVIDQAQEDYQTGIIAKTPAAYKAINDLKAAQTAGVQGLESYDAMVQAKATSSTLTAQQAVVQAALDQLPKLIAAVQALIAAVKPASLVRYSDFWPPPYTLRA